MTPRVRTLTRARTVASFGALVLAVATLPATLFPPAWLAAFAMPALVLHLLRARTRLQNVEVAGLAVLTQAAALFAAYHTIGPLDRLAGLGCTLLPPLVYLTARSAPADAARSLFLAFCLFLIGSILGGPVASLVFGFVATGVVVLFADTSLEPAEERASWRGATPDLGARVRGILPVVGASLVACLGTFQLLRALPSPSDPPRSPTVAGDRGPTQVGISDRFDLDRIGEGLLDLKADRLVRVRVDRPPAPGDLYLRCGHFDVAGLDRWSWRRPPVRRPDRTPWTVGRRTPALRQHFLEVELLGPTESFAYVPPGAVALAAPDGLIGAPTQSWFRFEDVPPDGTRIQIAWQDTRQLEIGELTARGDDGLLALPPDFQRWRPLFGRILSDPAVRGAVEPLAIAQGVATVLGARCDYALEGPTGPYPHAVLDFLEGDRRGFCMHFASATALCLRLAGVPCRIGVGLFGGEADPEVRGARVFGSRHAHAWVEIPFEEFGWVVFDPTPAAARTDRLWPELDAAASAIDEEDANAADALASPEARFDPFRDPLRHGWLWALVLLGTGIALRWRQPSADRSELAARRPSPAARSARRDLEALLRQLRRAGLPRLAGEPLERLGARLRDAGADLDLLAGLATYQEIRFGGRPYDVDRRARLAAAIAAARSFAARRQEAVDGPG